MNRSGFNKLFWGFLFIMFDYRLQGFMQGFDILPDIIGYILFAMGFGILIENSEHFIKAKKYNFPLIFLSIFQIYQPEGEGIYFGYFEILGIIIGIATLVLGILVVYHLCMGIKDMADQQGEETIYDDIYHEADKRWKQYLALSIASLAGFIFMFIPMLAYIYLIGVLIISILLMVALMKFMRKCAVNL